MENNGYIMLHRKILEWQWYEDVNVFKTFIHFLLKARHEDGYWKGVPLKRGELITGLHATSKEIGISERQYRTVIQKLEKTGEITVKTTNKYTIITICNYDIYQAKDEQNVKQTTNKRQTNDKQTTTNNNVNNVNNIKENILLKENENLNQIEQLDLLPAEEIITPEQQTALGLINFIKTNCENISKLKKQLTIQDAIKLTNKYTIDEIKSILISMENYTLLSKKYISVYLTMIKWLKREQIK
jgi:hypothetical protein